MSCVILASATCPLSSCYADAAHVGKQRHVSGGRAGTIQSRCASTGTVGSRGLFANSLRFDAATNTGGAVARAVHRASHAGARRLRARRRWPGALQPCQGSGCILESLGRHHFVAPGSCAGITACKRREHLSWSEGKYQEWLATVEFFDLVVARRGGTKHGCPGGNPIARAPNRIKSTADCPRLRRQRTWQRPHQYSPNNANRPVVSPILVTDPESRLEALDSG